MLRGEFDAAHEKRYAHVPFDVPPGVRALQVAYDYTDRIDSDPLLGGGNTLDIGLFDWRGIAESSPGFRGWSGSAKLSFTVTETWATPPYMAGPLLAGRWHVLLGPYKVGPRGCAYRIDISFSTQAGAPEPRPTTVQANRPRLREAAETGWLRGDLHCHTRHSDGDSWPAEMLERAVESGLEFLGVTDHNQTSHHADYASVTGDDLPIVLPGIEVTTYHGHWNAWGTPTWWDFREPTSEGTSRAMRTAAASGALVSVNHPKPFGPAWEYPDAVGYHAIEVWNGPWHWLNNTALAWWEQQLRTGKRVIALGGSDTHELKRPTERGWLGNPTTWARVEGQPSSESVLTALRAGHAFISRHPSGPQLFLHALDKAVEVRVVDGRGAVLLLVSDRGIEAAHPVAGSDWTTRWAAEQVRYIRAQVMDEHGEMLALSNPLFEPQNGYV